MVDTSGTVPIVTVLTEQGRRVSVHETDDPVAASRYAVAQLGKQSAPTVLVVIGLGMGYLLDALEETTLPTRVLALEPLPGVARAMLARRDWTNWLTSGRLMLLVGPDFSGAAEAWSLFARPECTKGVIMAPLIGREFPQAAARAKDKVRQILAGAQANEDARQKFAGRYLLQSLANLAVIGREGNVASLDGLFRGRPALVVGAGPSLDDNLPALAALQERAVIIGVDTTLRPLIAGGVRPHIIVAVDPAPLNAQHLTGVEGLTDIWLAAEVSLHPSVFGGFAGRTFVFKVSNHEPWPWLRTAGCDRGLLRTWGSVVTPAFDLALRMGCDPIIFAGLDLSYPVRRPYCANTVFDQTWSEAIALYGCTREQLVDDYFKRVGDLQRADLTGAPVLTSPHLVSFRDWLVEQTASDTSRRFINATGAGILHGARITQSSMHEALRSAPAIDRDVRDRLRSAHTSSLGNARRLRAAVAEMVAGIEEPQSARQVARWIDFTAGSVTAADVHDQVGAALNSLRE